MATHTICDGCDIEITQHTIAHQTLFRGAVVVADNMGKTLVDNHFDLCPGCRERFVRHSNPKGWPRHVRSQGDVGGLESAT